MDAKKLYFDIFPINFCNRKCRHCGFDSTMKCFHQSLSLDVVGQLVDEIKRIDCAVAINITGAGEPFLYENLPRMIELFLSSEKVKHVDLTTSGQLDSDTEEIRRFDEIVTMSQSQRLSVRLSFNEYNPTGTERFIGTLMRLIKLPHVRRIKIANRFSMERIISTHERLFECFSETVQMLEGDAEIQEGLLHPGYEYYRSVMDSDFFSRHAWNHRLHAFVSAQTFLMESSYFFDQLSLWSKRAHSRTDVFASGRTSKDVGRKPDDAFAIDSEKPTKTGTTQTGRRL